MLRILADGDDEDEAEEYDITGSTEADVDAGRISDESPVGAALIGKKVGDRVDVTLPTATSSPTRCSASAAAAKSVPPRDGRGLAPRFDRGKENAAWNRITRPLPAQPSRTSASRLPSAARNWRICAPPAMTVAITRYPQDAYSEDLKAEYKDLPAEAETGRIVHLAGRMMSKRVMGKASFAHLRDDKGDIQIFARRDVMGDEPYAAFKKLDIGDVIGCQGEVFRTKAGELSVRVSEVTLLAKSLLPMPEKFHGFTDREARYRQRYLDLIVNPDVKETFVKRSRIIREIRDYLDGKGSWKWTPHPDPLEIGASARPFITHHNTLDMDMYLRIETELYLKRLIVGGYDRVYEVGRIFRNEGMDPPPQPRVHLRRALPGLQPTTTA